MKTKDIHLPTFGDVAARWNASLSWRGQVDDSTRSLGLGENRNRLRQIRRISADAYAILYEDRVILTYHRTGDLVYTMPDRQGLLIGAGNLANIVVSGMTYGKTKSPIVQHVAPVGWVMSLGFPWGPNGSKYIVRLTQGAVVTRTRGFALPENPLPFEKPVADRARLNAHYGAMDMDSLAAWVAALEALDDSDKSQYLPRVPDDETLLSLARDRELGWPQLRRLHQVGVSGPNVRWPDRRQGRDIVSHLRRALARKEKSYTVKLIPHTASWRELNQTISACKHYRHTQSV